MCVCKCDCIVLKGVNVNCWCFEVFSLMSWILLFFVLIIVEGENVIILKCFLFFDELEVLSKREYGCVEICLKSVLKMVVFLL